VRQPDAFQGFWRASLIGSSATLVGSIRSVILHCSDRSCRSELPRRSVCMRATIEHAVKVEGLQPCLLTVLT
jgi:hypothetical protein